MDTFVASGKQRWDAFGVVVRSLVLGAPAGEVELLSEAVGPFAAVGFAEQVERHQVKQLGEPVAVSEGADAVTYSTVDLAQDLLDRAGRVQSAGIAGWDLRSRELAISVQPFEREPEGAVFATCVLGADCMLEAVPALETVEGVKQRDGDRVCPLGQDLVGEMLAQLAPQVPFRIGGARPRRRTGCGSSASAHCRHR